MLLPYYKLEAVHQFMDIFAKVRSTLSTFLCVYLDSNIVMNTKIQKCIHPFTIYCPTFSLIFFHILYLLSQVDENFSGDLDVNEWIRLFTSLNESVPVLEARMIFMKIGT